MQSQRVLYSLREKYGRRDFRGYVAPRDALMWHQAWALQLDTLSQEKKHDFYYLPQRSQIHIQVISSGVIFYIARCSNNQTKGEICFYNDLFPMLWTVKVKSPVILQVRMNDIYNYGVLTQSNVEKAVL
jgi:uncharacterized protein YpbB